MAQPSCPKCSSKTFQKSILSGTKSQVVHCAHCGCIVAGHVNCLHDDFARAAMENSYKIAVKLNLVAIRYYE